jgi:hypothetical protein
LYARIPDDIREPLLAELKGLKLRSLIKHFPAVLVIFSAIAAFAVMVKGHLILKLFEEYLPPQLSTTTFTLIVLGVTVLITASVLVHFFRQNYSECAFQECAYCSKCDAVDNFDTGHCPVCQDPPTQTASFYFTTAKDEIKILERWGCHACKNQKDSETELPPLSPTQS